MRKLGKIILLLILLFAFATSKEVEKVSIQLQWLDQFQFAGYYMAKEKGFYKQAQLDVEIKKFQKGVDIVKDVTSGKTTFGTGRTSLLIHKQNGLDVVILAAIFQHSPAALLVTDPNIITANNLINKRIMISNDAVTSASYVSMLFSEGIMKENFTVVPHSYNINDLIDGKVDAIAAYISNEPYLLEEKNIPYKYFHPKDYGYDFYGDLLYTSQQQLEQHPKRVEAFIKASIEGWKYAFNNIEETAKLIFEKHNIQNKSLKALIYEGEVLKKLAYNKNNNIGQINQERFNEIATTYRLLGLIKNNYTLDNLLYNPQSSGNLNLTIQEKKWLMKNKTIKLATNKDWVPIEFFNENGQYSGIAAGYLKLLEKKLDVKFELIANSYWYEMIQKIQNGELDMFMAIVNTPKRNDYMNFTTPYIEFPTVIVTKDDVRYIRNLEELSGKIVSIEENYYTQELLQSINNKIIFKSVNTTKDALEEVYKGEAFAYVGALPAIGHYIKELKYSNLKINGEAPFKTALSFGSSKKTPELSSILEKTLDSITKQEHDAIYNNWINITYEVKTDKVIIYTIIIMSMILLIIFLIRNRYLKKELLLRERFSAKLKELNVKLEKKNCTLKELSEIDTLTKIPNRRKAEELLNIEVERSYRNKLPLCAVMVDIDHFKKFNDNFGHKVGDIILHKIAQTLQKHIRIYDFIGRWGGEEFLVICPNSDLTQAYLLCKKLQELLKHLHIENLDNTHITVSCGIAQFNFDEDIDEFIKRADDEMYKAKNNGRNRIFPQVLS